MPSRPSSASRGPAAPHSSARWSRHASSRPRDRATARSRLGLPVQGHLVAVSGGGWGVGDLPGAVEAALKCDDTTVVVLAGRNEALRATLEERYGADPHVHVWGFTERMDELLRAADVAVHSTGGVTSLEALSCGCPLIGYGSSIGHIRVHNRTMAALGLITLADDRGSSRPPCATISPPPRGAARSWAWPAPMLRRR